MSIFDTEVVYKQTPISVFHRENVKIENKQTILDLVGFLETWHFWESDSPVITCLSKA